MVLTDRYFFGKILTINAEVAELAYALVSEASGATLESSNLSFRTKFAEGKFDPETATNRSSFRTFKGH